MKFYCFRYSRSQISWFSGAYPIKNLQNYKSGYDERLKIYHGFAEIMNFGIYPHAVQLCYVQLCKMVEAQL